MRFTANRNFFSKPLGQRFTKGNPYKIDAEKNPLIAKEVAKWIARGDVTVET